jgi:hypothetical protein
VPSIKMQMLGSEREQPELVVFLIERKAFILFYIHLILIILMFEKHFVYYSCVT